VHYIGLDLETTGLDNSTAKIIEVGIVKFDLNENKEELNILIDPGVPIPYFVENLTGIKDEDVKGQAKIQDVKEKIIDFIGDAPIMGHFIQFDTGFLNANGFDLKNIELDSYDLAQMLLPFESSYGLEILSKKFNLIHENAHRALDDVKANIDLLKELLKEAARLPQDIREKILKLTKAANMGWHDVLQITFDESPAPSKDEFLKTTISTPFQSSSAFLEAEAKRSDIQDLVDQTADKKCTLYTETKLSPEELINTVQTDQKGGNLIIYPNTFNLPNEINSVHILRSPFELLDIEKLEKNINRESMERHEATLYSKCLIWQTIEPNNQCKEHIKFGKDESRFWNSVAQWDIALPDAKNILTSPKVFIENHEKLQNYDHIIIYDLNALITDMPNIFTEYITPHKLKDLSGDMIDKTEETIDMLFGLLTNFFEKNRDGINTQIFLANQHLTSKEWINIKDLSAKLIDIIDAPVHAGRDLRLHHPKLKEILGYLSNLEQIPTNLSIWLKYIPNQETVFMGVLLTSIGPFLEKKIWPNFNKVTLINPTKIPSQKFINEQLGLPSQTIAILDPDPGSTKNNSPHIETVDESFPHPNDPSFVSATIKTIQSEQTKTKHIFVLAPNKNTLESLYNEFAENADDSWKILVQGFSGSNNKLLKFYSDAREENKNTIIIGNQGLWRYFLRTEYTELDTIIIMKIPFDHPHNPEIKAIADQYSNAYIQYRLPRAILHLHKIIGQTNTKNVVILDNRYNH